MASQKLRGNDLRQLHFNDVRIPPENVLGEPGEGFRIAMQILNNGRLSLGTGSVGASKWLLDRIIKHVKERRQFGKPLIAFPRVSAKLAMMAVEIMIARQLTYFAAREKDEGRRCDLEAGMAKLLAARVAWACADNALQIHGGNGFALEDPISRVLCDARILSIFEGAAEIEAHVIARRLLDGSN